MRNLCVLVLVSLIMTWSVHDKHCLITGANAGIGKETALALAQRGARVVMVCRDRARGTKAQQEVSRAGRHDAALFIADLSVMAQVRALASRLLEQYLSLPIVISNAGVVMPQRTVTADGYEATFAINHLAPFLLINLLLDRIISSAPARIVVVASQVEAAGHINFNDLHYQTNYQPLVSYRQSKLANVMMTYQLARQLKDTDVTVNCLHPGVIATNLLCDYNGSPRALSKMNRLRYPGAKEGAKTSIRLATDASLSGVSGKYFRPQGEAQTSKQSYDQEAARRLWSVSETLTGLTTAQPVVHTA